MFKILLAIKALAFAATITTTEYVVTDTNVIEDGYSFTTSVNDTDDTQLWFTQDHLIGGETLQAGDKIIGVFNDTFLHEDQFIVLKK